MTFYKLLRTIYWNVLLRNNILLAAVFMRISKHVYWKYFNSNLIKLVEYAKSDRPTSEISLTQNLYVWFSFNEFNVKSKYTEENLIN